MVNRLLKMGRKMRRVGSAREIESRSPVLPLILSIYPTQRNSVQLSLLGSLGYSSRHRARHSSESHQVARGHGELELLIDVLQSAKRRLAKPADGLARRCVARVRWRTEQTKIHLYRS